MTIPISGNVQQFGFQNFVVEPNDDQSSSNTNPRGLNLDDLKPSFGVERINIDQMYELEGEKDDNDKTVLEITTPQKDKRCRFFGNWKIEVGSTGSQISIQNLPAGYTNKVLSVTFIGTGLNILALNGITATRLSCDIYLDGVDTGNTFQSIADNVLSNKNVKTNETFNLVSNIPYGIHTVDLYPTSGSPNGSRDIRMYGFEIIVDDSDEIKRQAGSYFINGKLTQVNSDSWANPDGGTDSDGISVNPNDTGAKILECINTKGERKYYTTNVPASPSYTSSVDHSDEEIQKAYYWREFGAGLTSDFSRGVISGTAYACFVLDDNVTSLMGHHITTQFLGSPAKDCLSMDGSGDEILLTFVGTGLDLVWAGHNATPGTLNQTTFYVDGTSVEVFAPTNVDNTLKVKPIVSGLFYGTHTLKIRTTGAAGTVRFCIKDFIVYEPKTPKFFKLNKPTNWESNEGYWDLPNDVMSLTCYNIFADFSGFTGASDIMKMSQGVLRHHAQREIVYSGSNWSTSYNTNTHASFYSSTNAQNEYCEFIFFGTGTTFRYFDGAGFSQNVRVQLDDFSGAGYQDLNSGNFGTLTFAYSDADPRVGADSAYINQDVEAGSFYNKEVRYSDLPLGLYKIKLLKNDAGVLPLNINSFDVITPIHHSQMPIGNMNPTQVTNTIGNCAMKDLRELSPVKDSKGAKRIATARGVASAPAISANSYVPMPDMYINWYSDGINPTRISFIGMIYGSVVSGPLLTDIYIDGVSADVVSKVDVKTASYDDLLTIEWVGILSKGTHHIEVKWRSDNGWTITLDGTLRRLFVHEI